MDDRTQEEKDERMRIRYKNKLERKALKEKTQNISVTVEEGIIKTSNNNKQATQDGFMNIDDGFHSGITTKIQNSCPHYVQQTQTLKPSAPSPQQPQQQLSSMMNNLNIGNGPYNQGYQQQVLVPQHNMINGPPPLQYFQNAMKQPQQMFYQQQQPQQYQQMFNAQPMNRPPQLSQPYQLPLPLPQVNPTAPPYNDGNEIKGVSAIVKK